MFYSHEVLTSRKYGVATVWLVATLGSKSTLKKVSRKAILDVDVPKACETINHPEAPMALRLQSNLLYGVSRVYSQQCGYVLADAQNAQNGMRALFRVMQTSALEAEGGTKGRADHLLLQDDPNFLPDFDLLPIDLDRLDFDVTITEDSQRSSIFSPRNSQRDGSIIGSQQSVGGLLIPPSTSSLLGGPVGGAGGFSIRGDSGAGTRIGSGYFQQNEPEGLLDDDLGLTVDADGNVHMEDRPIRQPRGPSTRVDRTDAGSEPASARVRREHDEGQGAEDMFGRPDDDGFVPLQDDYDLLPEGEAFLPRQLDEPEQSELPQHHTTSETAASAPLRRQRRAPLKVLPLDTTTELRNGDLARWNQDYLANMTEGLRHKQAARAAALAKKNAEFWMLGSGVGVLDQADHGPLNMFSGVQLLETLTGVRFTLNQSGKHPREEAEKADTGRRVRSRREPSSDELARGDEPLAMDDGYVPMGDDTIEQGREAPTPLDDRHLSSAFPWNLSTGSRRPTGAFSAGALPTSASFGGAGLGMGALSRRGSRLVSASPLMGRGAAPGLDEAAMDDSQLPGSQTALASGADDFELFGPAAQVDTQTAAQSQWQRAALDGESVNFLAFIKAGIEQADGFREDTAPGDEVDEQLRGTVDFETLLPPESNSKVVAAQAMLHMLTLGTKNMVSVEQEEAFGPISMRVVVAQ